MIEKKLIDYLLNVDGNLSDETWYDIGLKFNIEPPDKKRAEKDKEYKRKSIATKANDIWRNYLKTKNSLQLVKEVYKEGKLSTEVYNKPAPESPEIDLSLYEVEKFTTNPNGNAWLKYKKKDQIFTKDHVKSLSKILIKDIKPLQYNFTEKYIDKALFIYTSDKHIGALTKEDSIYSNLYNEKEIRKRLLNKILDSIEENISNFGKFESLFIMDLGDALDGFNQKTTGGLRGTSGHTLPQQMNNREQHDLYVKIHKELFDIITTKNYAKNIYFIATSNSNHGGDFEYGAMKNLETYLNVKYPFIKTCINYYALNHFIYGEHAIIFGHGKDSEDMKHGLPLNLNEKTEIYINDYINKNDLSKYNITVVTGDLHQSSINYGKNFRYKKVLSQYGSSKWMHTNFGSGSPGLSIEVINKNNKNIFSSDIFFQVKDESNTGIKF